MPDIEVRLAESEADVEAAREISRAWVDWQLAAYPEFHDRILVRFDPVAYARTLERLPEIHARPRGAILLAELDARPVGCAMYHEHSADAAEIKRLFVLTEGRGHGLGRALLEAMFTQMRADGYDRAVFTSARFLTHARALYDSCGFRDIPAFGEIPAEIRPLVYAMERPLTPAAAPS